MMSTEAVAGLRVLVDTFVAGHPKTKGSLTAVTGTYLKDKPSSEAWRRVVVGALLADMAKRQSVGAARGRIGVRVISYLQPGGDVTNWWEHAQAWILGKLSGDVDKLERNVLDALSACEKGCSPGCKKHAGVIGDDAQVWDLFGHKRLAAPGMMPGQKITVWQISEGEPWT